MRALMKLAPGEGHVELKEVPAPEAGEGEVVIDVQVAGVCGTDVHMFYDRFPSSPPVVMGHEFSGVVASVGAGVESFKAGERVVSENNPFACLRCKICELGYPNMCPRKRAMGIHSDGCFAEQVKLPAHLLHRVPDKVTFEEAALSEPLAVAVHAVAHRCGIESGDTVVVFGPGTIGLLAAQVARAEGAREVLLAGTNRDQPVRLKCAEALDIETVDVESEDVTERVMSMTDGLGADVAVEASGSPLAIASALRLLRKAGRLAVVGITGRHEVSVNWDGMVSKAVSVLFAYSSLRADWEKGLQLLAESKVQAAPLITHRFRVEQWKEAFDALERLEAIKPVFGIANGA